MMFWAAAAVAVGGVGVDGAPRGNVVGVARAGKRGPLRDPEVRFDGIEPGGVGGRGDRVDVQAPEQRQDARMIMDVVQVIHNDEEALARVARPQPPKGLAHLDDPFAPPEQAAQAVGMDVVEAEELLGAFAAVIGSPHALRPATTPPGDPPQPPWPQGAPPLKAKQPPPRRAPPLKPAESVFFRSNAGSSEVFQVRIRWARSPSRPSSRRTHSSVIRVLN